MANKTPSDASSDSTTRHATGVLDETSDARAALAALRANLTQYGYTSVFDVVREGRSRITARLTADENGSSVSAEP